MPDPSPDLSYAIGLPPAEAIAFFESKGYAIGWSWEDIRQEAHAKAFTVAGVMKADVLADLKNGLADALKTGGTQRDYRLAMEEILRKKGWWGKHAQTDLETGEMSGKGLTPRRLGTIFDINMQSAYGAGRYKALMANVEDRPYLQYWAVRDQLTRPAHAAIHGRVFHYSDPILQIIWTPNGYGCRCTFRSYDADDMLERGLTLSSSEGKLSTIEVPTSRRPGAPTMTVTRFEYAPGRYFSPDPGFNFNPATSALKPFTPPPLDTLPRTFPQGVPLPDLPPATPAAADAKLLPGLPQPDYARGFLGEFGADIGKGVVFKDVTGAPLAINEALFQDSAGNWKADKNGRGPYMRLLARAVKMPDEIWLRWEESRDRPGTWLLKRRYIKSFLVQGEDGSEAQYALSVFEHGQDGWSGSTAMIAQPDRGEAARRRYIEKQRDGFLLYFRNGESGQ